MSIPFFSPRQRTGAPTEAISLRVVEVAYTEIGPLLTTLRTRRKGLTAGEARRRLQQYGLNEIAHTKPLPRFLELLKAFHSPFIYLLLGLVLVSWLIGDLKAPLLLLLMVLLSGSLRFVQEDRATQTVRKLREPVETTALVSRLSSFSERERRKELFIRLLVPGDIVHLAAGTMVPADVRFLTAKDLFINQAILSGESLPVQKHDWLGSPMEKLAITYAQQSADPLDTPTVGFMGTTLVSGTATAVVVATGHQTYLGSLTRQVRAKRAHSRFEQGINGVSWLLLRFMAVLVPIVFFINGVGKGHWSDAFFFAVAVAVGLTPEMLPAMVSANLAQGARMMATQQVIVKRLPAIQTLGAMDVLCTDKTGTLTQNQVLLERHLNVHGEASEAPLQYGYLHSFFQTGVKHLLDVAVLRHTELEHPLILEQEYHKVGEVPFDFVRRRSSVILVHQQGHCLICKGAVEEVLSLCQWVQSRDQVVPLTETLYQETLRVAQQLNARGFRVLAVAQKRIEAPQGHYTAQDECQLILVGYLAFLDPPKASAAQAIAALQQHGVAVKVITGDNDSVTRKICQDVGLNIERLVLGETLEQLSNAELAALVDTTTVFAKVSPPQKARIVQMLQQQGHTVGFLGDGMNDALALRMADVSMSVDTAVDIAKETADIILLEQSLTVLAQGVIEGRRTFGNIIKYLKMTASANFGNVFSIVGASLILPFLPMLPSQLLLQNLLYELTQVTLPFDCVDAEIQTKPQVWARQDLGRFMLILGPTSSLFDYLTYALLWFGLGATTQAAAPLFQTGWFVEGLLSQTLIMHLLRTSKVPFLQSTATWPVILATVLMMLSGLLLPLTPLGFSFGLVPLPLRYFPWLVSLLLGYCLLIQGLKVWYVRTFKQWL